MDLDLEMTKNEANCVSCYIITSISADILIRPHWNVGSLDGPATLMLIAYTKFRRRTAVTKCST
jgi:hypothetical protein